MGAGSGTGEAVGSGTGVTAGRGSGVTVGSGSGVTVGRGNGNGNGATVGSGSGDAVGSGRDAGSGDAGGSGRAPGTLSGGMGAADGGGPLAPGCPAGEVDAMGAGGVAVTVAGEAVRSPNGDGRASAGTPVAAGRGGAAAGITGTESIPATIVPPSTTSASAATAPCQVGRRRTSRGALTWSTSRAPSASATASARLDAPSLPNAFERCQFTVLTEIRRSAAISLLVRPAATRVRI